MKRSAVMMAKELDADIDVTTMTDDAILNPYKVSLDSKDDGKESFLSKLTESKLAQVLEEQMMAEEDAEQEHDEGYDNAEEHSYHTGTPGPEKVSRRNPALWQRPDIRGIVEDFINKDITSRGAANKISEILGRSVSHSTVLTYANRLLREMKREADDPSYEVQVEEDSLTSGGDLTYDVRFELVKTNRGNDNGLAVHEDNGFVRLYRRTSSTGRCSHYRCSTCDHLYEKIGQGERPSIKMRDSIICSDPYPAHNQLCTPTPEEVFRRAQHDLEARQLNACRRILTNSRFKEMKWAREHQLANSFGNVMKRSEEEEEEAVNKCIESLMTRCPSSMDDQDELKEAMLRGLIENYKRGEISSLTELAKEIRESTGIDVSGPTLCRYLKKPTEEKSVEPEESGSVLIAQPSLSKYLNETIITVPEGDGYRQYSFMKKSADGIRSYYRCLGCSRAKRIFGPDRQAYVKVEYGEIIDRPLHHRKCESQSEEVVLVQNLDRECRRSIRKGEKNPREAHLEGLGKVAEIEASFSADESLSGSLQKLFPPWERVRSAYFRQKDLLKKAAVAAELEDEAYQAAEGDGDMGRYEEIIGNVDESFEVQPPGTSVELTPEMAALKNQMLFEVQQTIRREVNRAINRATVIMEQRFDTKIMQIFDEIFRAPEEVDAEEIDEYAVQEFPSTSENATFNMPKRRRLESAETNDKLNDVPFSIPACYLSRNRSHSKEDDKKKDNALG